MDFDGDGYLDLVTATFDGSPHVSYGAEDGFAQPVRLRDAAGERILIASYWDYDEKAHLDTGRSLPEGEARKLRCISALAFDWDGDGDHDLLLGSYEEGRLFRQMNEGTNAEPKFTGRNIPVEAGGRPIFHAGKMTAPRLVDWDGDGDQDLVFGSFKGSALGGGGVYLAINEGRAGAPAFAALEALIETPATSGTASAGPNEGLYVDPVDFDGDGDLDLLVGGYSIWEPASKALSAEEAARFGELQAHRAEIVAKLRGADSAERYRALAAELAQLDEELDALQSERQRRGFVWLYERVEPETDGRTALVPSEAEPLVAALTIEPGRDGRHRASVRLAILEGWHAYGADADSPYEPLQVALELPDGSRRVGAWDRPRPTGRSGSQGLPSFEGELEFSCDVELGDPAMREALVAVVRFQVCNADLCLPPDELRLSLGAP